MSESQNSPFAPLMEEIQQVENQFHRADPEMADIDCARILWDGIAMV
jgi:hypothetical protein